MKLWPSHYRVIALTLLLYRHRVNDVIEQYYRTKQKGSDPSPAKMYIINSHNATAHIATNMWTRGLIFN